jgi:hypothetical protein
MSISIRGGSQVSISEPAEVIIDHTNDSIRIGDGTDLVGTTSVCDEVGLNVYPLDVPNDREILPQTMVLADTEVAIAVPANTKMFSVKIRGAASKYRIAYSAGETATNYIEYLRGSIYQSPTFHVGSLSTVYLRTDKPNVIAEFEFWKCS